MSDSQRTGSPRSGVESTRDELAGPLALDEATMREVGYKVVDALIDHFLHRDERPAGAPAQPVELARPPYRPVPTAPSDPRAVIDRIFSEVLGPNPRLRTDHRRFFAYVPSPTNFISVMADAITSGTNVFAGHWLAAPGPTIVELETIDWLREIVGFPEEAGGIFLSGGSAANESAIVTADAARGGLDRRQACIYASGQTHGSLAKAARILGFPSERLRWIATDSRLRLDVNELARQVAEDERSGLTPLMVVANAGTTNTGAVDPLPEIVDFCRRRGLWLHVDGAYGAAAMLTEAGKEELAGLECVDSLTIDPHKWWFQPYEIGCLLVRDKENLVRAFHTSGDYLRDLEGRTEVNLFDYGPQLTRGFRALKLWTSLRVFGLDAFTRAVESGIEMARYAEQVLRRRSAGPDSAGWRIVTPAQLGVATFRWHHPGTDPAAEDQIIEEVVEAMLTDGFAVVTSTVIEERPVLRLCPLHPAVTPADIDGTIERLETFARRAVGRRYES